MSDTSGRKCAGLSNSAYLQSSLESRLRQNLDGLGSQLYALTWKAWDMPSGLQICALRASARRISGSDCIGGRSGWPTPIMSDSRGSKYSSARGKFQKKLPKLPGVAHMCLGGAMLAGAGQCHITAAGKMLTGDPSGMPAGGPLNPAHSRWLMGFPPEWDDCAVTAMPSSRKSRRHS